MTSDIFEPFPTELVTGIKNLVVLFVLRQQLCVLAMIELRPDLLKAWTSGRVLGIDLEPYHKAFLRKREAAVAYQGTWRNEWEYLLHGIGCKLTNVTSGELLEWDAPNPKAFRLDWFWQHLLWRVENETDDINIEACSEWIRSGENSDAVFRYLVDTKFMIQTTEGYFILADY